MADERSSVSSEEGDWRACVEYETKHVHIGELEIKVFQMEELPVAASLFMLAEMDANDTEISGKRLWTGSHLLSRYLSLHPEFVRGKTTLELGAGTGICSIVAKKLGATECTATDGDEDVVALLTKNVDLNSVDIATHSLFWGDSASTEAFLLRHPTAFSHTDVVLAGDVLYKRELLPLLFSTVLSVLSNNSKACFMLCHIPRAEVTHQIVQEQIASSGLQFQELELPVEDAAVELEECPIEDIERARLYCITKEQ